MAKTFEERVQALTLYLMEEGKCRKEDLPRVKNVARDIVYRQIGREKMREARAEAALTDRPFERLLKQ